MSLESSVARDYRVETPTEQTKLGDDIILGIGTTGASTFTGLAAQITAFIPINKAYKVSITDADKGDKDKINDRNDYRDLTWLPAVDLLADGVDGVALGSKTVVDLSGFPGTATERVARTIPNQMIINAQGGVSGSNSIDISSKTKMDADGYLTLASETGTATYLQNGNQITILTPDSDGKTIHKSFLFLSTTKDGTMTGLTRKDDLDVQQVGFNAAGCSVLSNKANVLVP